jgi:1-acyl-sn-glycerol-3-phosphate acyltransferase
MTENVRQFTLSEGEIVEPRSQATKIESKTTVKKKQVIYTPLANHTWSHKAIAGMARGIFTLFTRLEIKGFENIPPTGPVIAVSNHLDNMDSILILMKFPRWINFMGKEELFKNPLGAKLMRYFHVFPVQRGENSIRGKREALRIGKQILDAGQMLGTFPEGTRSKKAQLQQGMPGIIYIGMGRPAPMLPMAITGTQQLRGISWLFKRPKVTLTVGKPFNLPASQGGIVSKEFLTECTTYTMERIAALLPPEYRGVYGASSDVKTGN